MSRIKCSECGKLAHTVVEGKTYCADCVPEPTMPVTIEETVVNEVVIEKIKNIKPWSDPPKVIIEKVERPRPWPAPEPLGSETQLTEYFKPLEKCIEKKKSWVKTFLGYFANPFKN